MTIGSEYRHKTITRDLPRHPPSGSGSWCAKVVALLGIGAVYGLICLVGSVGVGAHRA